MAKTSLQVEIQKAQGEFISRVPARIDAMREHLQQALSGDAEALALLHNDFHALSGTAATYGYQHLGAMAAAATRTLTDLEAHGWPRQSFGSSALSTAIDSIEQALAASAALRPTLD